MIHLGIKNQNNSFSTPHQTSIDIFFWIKWNGSRGCQPIWAWIKLICNYILLHFYALVELENGEGYGSALARNKATEKYINDYLIATEIVQLKQIFKLRGSNVCAYLSHPLCQAGSLTLHPQILLLYCCSLVMLLLWLMPKLGASENTTKHYTENRENQRISRMHKA